MKLFVFFLFLLIQVEAYSQVLTIVASDEITTSDKNKIDEKIYYYKDWKVELNISINGADTLKKFYYTKPNCFGMAQYKNKSLTDSTIRYSKDSSEHYIFYKGKLSDKFINTPGWERVEKYNNGIIESTEMYHQRKSVYYANSLDTIRSSFDTLDRVIAKQSTKFGIDSFFYEGNSKIRSSIFQYHKNRQLYINTYFKNNKPFNSIQYDELGRLLAKIYVLDSCKTEELYYYVGKTNHIKEIIITKYRFDDKVISKSTYDSFFNCKYLDIYNYDTKGNQIKHTFLDSKGIIQEDINFFDKEKKNQIKKILKYYLYPESNKTYLYKYDAKGKLIFTEIYDYKNKLIEKK